MPNCEIHWFTNECSCILTSDQALAELRVKLTGDFSPVKRPVMVTHGEQYNQDWTLTINGQDFVSPDAPDFMVEAAGESLHREIDKIMQEAADKIRQALGDHYMVNIEKA